MPTYTAINDTQIQPEAPVTSELMTLLRDNPIAVAEVSNTAPLASGVWHPYDMVTVGDGADGIIYDHSVDGTQSTITSPDFEDLYEYMFMFDVTCNFSTVVGSGTYAEAGFKVDLYRETDAAYSTVGSLVDVATADPAASLTTGLSKVVGTVNVILPRLTKKVHQATGTLYTEATSLGNGFNVGLSVGVFYDSTLQKTLRARFTKTSATTSGSFTGGTIAMFRRRIAVE